jgi:hypothetical protein
VFSEIGLSRYPSIPMAIGKRDKGESGTNGLMETEISAPEI